jgi:hypothetical protein
LACTKRGWDSGRQPDSRPIPRAIPGGGARWSDPEWLIEPRNYGAAIPDFRENRGDGQVFDSSVARLDWDRATQSRRTSDGPTVTAPVAVRWPGNVTLEFAQWRVRDNEPPRDSCGMTSCRSSGRPSCSAAFSGLRRPEAADSTLRSPASPLLRGSERKVLKSETLREWRSQKRARRRCL